MAVDERELTSRARRARDTTVAACRPRAPDLACRVAEAARHRHLPGRVAVPHLDRVEARRTQLASPADTFQSLCDNWSLISEAMSTTLRRGIQGYAMALAIGVAIGAAVARIPVLRAAIGSMITGLQTMPSVAWFPFALVLFQLSARAPSSSWWSSVQRRRSPTDSSTASTTSRRCCSGPGKVLGAKRFDSLPLRGAPCRAAVVRRRAEAGLGVRVAQPARRRDHRRHRRVLARPTTGCEPRRRRHGGNRRR